MVTVVKREIILKANGLYIFLYVVEIVMCYFTYEIINISKRPKSLSHSQKTHSRTVPRYSDDKTRTTLAEPYRYSGPLVPLVNATHMYNHDLCFNINFNFFLCKT